MKGISRAIGTPLLRGASFVLTLSLTTSISACGRSDLQLDEVEASFCGDGGCSVCRDPGGARAVAAGTFRTCELMTSGGVRCWGDGLGTVPVADAIEGVQAIAAGKDHTCALTNAGGVRCWGNNAEGELGDGTFVDRLAPPTTDALTGVQAITAGYEHTCALMTTGTVRCWGNNDEGQLGDGTTTHRATPTQDVLTGVSAIAAGLAHTCALMMSGGVRCWGGIRPNPPQRLRPPTTDLLTGVRAITAGGPQVCALVDAGIRCWRVDESPGDIRPLTDVQSFDMGLDDLCAVLKTGDLVCATDLGVGGGSFDSGFIKKLAGVQAVAVSEMNVYALMRDGHIRGWGSNTWGQLASDTTSPESIVDVTEPPSACR